MQLVILFSTFYCNEISLSNELEDNEFSIYKYQNYEKHHVKVKLCLLKIRPFQNKVKMF